MNSDFDNGSVNLAAPMWWLLAVLLIFLGEPDLHDAIIARIMP